MLYNVKWHRIVNIEREATKKWVDWIKKFVSKEFRRECALSYLLGLITGRGHILTEERRILVEFAHSNQYLGRIVYCDQCGDLVTGMTRSSAKCKSSDAYGRKPAGNRKCSSSFVADSQFKFVEQRESTRDSLKNEIIPFLENLSSVDEKVELNISWSNSCTFLLISFQYDSSIFQWIKEEFGTHTSFHNFEIPEYVKYDHTPREAKIEFINGMLDTAGFMQKGGWAPYQGADIHGRMRGYFEFPRNWKIPVEMCNFLKKLGFPTHTIDWGHPQNRDVGLEDYHKKGRMGWREHQLKFFPEYYDEVKIRILHKRELFIEMQEHNNNQFDGDIDCHPPKRVNPLRIKAHHPQIDSNKVPDELRGTDVDSYWQICHLMGCMYTAKFIDSTNDLIFINGTGDGEYSEIVSEFLQLRKEKTDKIMAKWQNYQRQVISKKSGSKLKEEDLYEPIAEWLQNDESLADNEVTFDTATTAMDGYLHEEGLEGLYPQMADFNQKPDVVGLKHDGSRSVFIEVKLGALNLQDLGQLLGYCVMASPDRAILVSPKGPGKDLVAFLLSFPEVLEFGNGNRIEVGQWDQSNSKYQDGGYR